MVKYAGACPLKIQMVSEQENISVTLPSSKYRLAASSELLQTLGEIKGVKVSLN
jgi:hypothetical protein